MKKTKLLVLILSLALLVCGALGISASAGDSDPTVAIEGKNISYMEVSTLVVAVSYENTSLENVKLNVWYGAKDGAPSILSTTETVEVGGKECAMFVLDGTTAKDIADKVYFEAFVDGSDVKTATETYSVLEFALEGVVNSTDAKEIARYQSIITYATSIQEWLKADGKFDGTLAKDYSYVQVEDGTIDGLTKGVFANGTAVTPAGENVKSWSITYTENGETVTDVIKPGESFTVKGNTKIEPSEYFETFEDGTLPTTIQAVNTHPSVVNLNNSYTISNPVVAPLEGRDGKVLWISTAYQSSKTILKISETSAADTNANAVEFSTDIRLSPNTNGTQCEFFNLVLSDANGNVAFNIVLRNNSNSTDSAKGNVGLVIRTPSGAKDTRTLLANGLDTWFNLRVVYSYDANTSTLAVTVYVNGNSLATFNMPYNEGAYIDDSAITNAYVIVNGNSGSHAINAKVYLDNVKFEHIVAD